MHLRMSGYQEIGDKMLTWTTHHCDFSRGLPMARSLREQIDWTRVQRETAHSPFARAFMVLLDGLEVVSLAEISGISGPVREAVA